MTRTLKPSGFGDGTLKPFGDGIWTATTPIRFVGTWFPHVMTVVRLSSGDLLLHSPCQPSNDLIRAISRLGSVAHVVAPNWFHDLYLHEYRALYLQATFWAPAFLRRQRRRIIDCVLDGKTRPPWFEEMPHYALRGLLTFDESLFFHKLTRTLIVADLLMNVSPDGGTPPWTRLGYRIFGLDGRLRVFPVLRWFGVADRGSLQSAARQVFEWNPERLIVAHGKAIREGTATELRAAFRWLGV